jgi:hypothetical protein
METTNIESVQTDFIQTEFSNIEGSEYPFNPLDIPAPTPLEVTDTKAAPLSVSTYKPFDDQNSIICQISPAKFDSLLKVLKVLINEKSSNDSIIIKDSMITQSSNGSIICTNVLDIFDNRKITIHIINPKKYIKLFNNFKNNNDVFILDDGANSRFIITNGEIKLFLPKQIETLVQQVELPNMSNYKLLCTTKIDKATRNIITGLSADATYTDYLIQENQLKAIHVPDTAIYLFNEFIKDANSAKLDETNADLALRSTMCLTIPAEDYEINIGYSPEGSYIAATSCNTGFIKIDIYEPLEIATGGNILI